MKAVVLHALTSNRMRVSVAPKRLGKKWKSFRAAEADFANGCIR